MVDPTIVPDTFADLLRDYDVMIQRQIIGTARRRHVYLQPCDVEDIKQEVYARIVEKEFLARERVLWGERGGGRFDASIRIMTRRCTTNVLLRESVRPSATAVSLNEAAEGNEPNNRLMRELLRLGQAVTLDTTQRQLETTEYLDRFAAWLDTRWGGRVKTWCTLEDGTHLPHSMATVFRLWREFGEHRQSTHQIACYLQLSDARVRQTKLRIRQQVPPFMASLA